MPSYSEIISYSWKKYRANFLFLIGVILIFVGYSVITGTIQESLRPQIGYGADLVGFVFGLINVVLEIGFIVIVLKLIDDKKPDFNDLYRHYNLFLKFFFASILTGLIVLVGLILLIIPGIYFLLRLQFTYFLVVDRGLGPIEGVKESWNLTRGKVLRILGLDLLLIVINILGALALLVGLLVTIPLSSIAMAYFYRKLK